MERAVRVAIIGWYHDSFDDGYTHAFGACINNLLNKWPQGREIVEDQLIDYVRKNFENQKLDKAKSLVVTFDLNREKVARAIIGIDGKLFSRRDTLYDPIKALAAMDIPSTVIDKFKEEYYNGLRQDDNKAGAVVVGKELGISNAEIGSLSLDEFQRLVVVDPVAALKWAKDNNLGEDIVNAAEAVANGMKAIMDLKKCLKQ